MAAILEPHRLPPIGADRRPELRLLPSGRTDRASGPAGLGLGPLAVVAVVIVSLLAVIGAVAVGRGALAGLAPAPPGPAAPAAPAAPASAAVPAAGADVVVVEPGDTLWGIARRLEPTGDVRPVVDRLVAANGSTVIEPGQELIVPG
ncbi:hypothetical protein BH23ACT2_BH23ACT2_02200 [soil metagenome]